MDDERPEPRPMTPFVALGWTIGVSFVFELLRLMTAHSHSEDHVDLVGAFGCQVVAYLLGLFAILRIHAPNTAIRDFLAIRKTHALFYPLGAMLGVTLYGVADGMFDLIAQRYPTGDEGKIEALIAAASPVERAAFFIGICLIGPVLEEVIFRGALVRPLLKTTTKVTVAVVTAFGFAFAHLEWQSFFPIALVGLAMAWLRIASGSLIPSLILHVVFNSVQFVLILRTIAVGETPQLAIPLLVAGAVGSVVLLGILRALGQTDQALRARALDGVL